MSEINEAREIVFETLDQAMDGSPNVRYVDTSGLASGFTLCGLAKALIVAAVVGVVVGVIVVYGAALVF